MELVTGNNRAMGSITAYRYYTPRPLQIDVNLLTIDFPVVLAESLQRSLEQNMNIAIDQAAGKMRAAQVS